MFADLVQLAQAELDARAALIQRFEPGGDLEWIENPAHRANLIGAPAMLASFIVELSKAPRDPVGAIPEVWNQCHPSALRGLALVALEHADRREAAHGAAT